LHNKDQQDALFSSFISIIILYMLRIDYSSSGGSFTIYTAYVIYHASVLTGH